MPEESGAGTAVYGAVHAMQVIAEKLLEYLRSATDDGQKAEVAQRIGELAERFAPDTQWFIDTMNQVGLPAILPAYLHLRGVSSRPVSMLASGNWRSELFIGTQSFSVAAGGGYVNASAALRLSYQLLCNLQALHHLKAASAMCS